ncbi:lipase maturation factor 2 [Parasteatoda tepidariorum]|uniref:lipase maturation factor 2 n=1 Tax=Parasteatoda tepidariorum TaxID=114398 RepID=UPI00077F9D32|nr:lipase maturation factor 2 [Parasteatoda tepidariorum]
MREIKLTRNFFLWCMSVVYLSAFSSLYVQIPGLFGDKGILPARGIISIESGAEVIKKKAEQVPTLLWLAPALGIDVHLMMDLIALLGMVISFGSMVWGRMRDICNFTLLWILYFSLFQIGQTFLWFQWDTLLLEVGFLAILVAPLGFLQSSIKTGFFSSLPNRPHDIISMWMVKWLLFRFMFASGIVKLTSMCPTWWDLSALYHHFESQCIPTPLAWYAHHLPQWLLKLGVVGTFVIEIPLPFLFFAPIRSLRIFSFYAQIFFQILIILTGNFNFFNILTIVMCLSLVDDDFLLSLVGRPTPTSKSSSGAALRWTRKILTLAIENIVILCIVYGTIKYFSLKFQPSWTIDSKIGFSAAEFRNTLSEVMPATVFIGAFALCANILLAVYNSITEPGIFKKLYALIGTAFVSVAALWLFTISVVPHGALDVQFRNNLWPIVHRWHKRVEEFHISNSYGLFRRMTGVDGRPEIVIEGSNSLTAGWKEYHFLYKPGELSQRPPVLIPHQPRLDWQLWFAALGTYEHNPWFVSLMYRLLDGEKDVLKLLDTERLPFPPSKPPKYIRAILYKYSFTSPSGSSKKPSDWWTRRKVREYFSSANMDEKQMSEFLDAASIPMEKTRYLRVTNAFLKKSLIQIRDYITSVQPTTFIWSLIGTGFCINFIAPILRL